ncbi:hypothetical protein Tco_1446717 [Tanacetum coccineum]
MYNGARIRIRNNSQQVEDVTELVVPGNARKIVRGPTFMPKVCTKTEEDCISVLFNEYGQPVDKETTGTLALFIGSLARSGKFCKLHKQWLLRKLLAFLLLHAPSNYDHSNLQSLESKWEPFDQIPSYTDCQGGNP